MAATLVLLLSALLAACPESGARSESSHSVFKRRPRTRQSFGAGKLLAGLDKLCRGCGGCVTSGAPRGRPPGSARLPHAVVQAAPGPLQLAAAARSQGARVPAELLLPCRVHVGDGASYAHSLKMLYHDTRCDGSHVHARALVLLRELSVTKYAAQSPAAYRGMLPGCSVSL